MTAELTRRSEITCFGGAPYLHTLVNAVPTAANVAWYAEIVREYAVLRRLAEAGTRIVQGGRSGVGVLVPLVRPATPGRVAGAGA